ncbi:hypothetical protein BKA82DRAFT_10462 [Pisolithus tinctorius]|uniref:Uncharacterized protein n=1 Tax=Pisolithus tinctorius Marx 270 TaxID=870435 RepID=A0A0C3NUW6_PISTI|nr:hypothetical protein BKA82DRAFT_10462 [Pisolithus tinctorius]KIN99008.1 hypothetical protein M404DRAFT_10462 [Pisolithus tinctorius Marx 270]
MAGGQPKKHQRNMLGMHGQNQKLPPAVDDGCVKSRDEEPVDQVQVEINGLKLNYEAEYEEDFETDVDEEDNPVGLWNDKESACRLVEMVKKDEGGATWLLDWLQRRLRSHAMAQQSLGVTTPKQSIVPVHWSVSGLSISSEESPTAPLTDAEHTVSDLESNMATDQTEWKTIANEPEWRVSPSWSQDSTVQDGAPGPDEDVGESQLFPVMEA